MKLIKAHIFNFGKFHEEDIFFTDGLNTFLHENGWGKTTLSVFIKAMFYGMEHSAKKNPDENEKLKYNPWQGGKYGGSLVFQHNEKEYCVTRIFSSKKNEDFFELRDTKTNKISHDFSSELGTELFDINRETYARSLSVNVYNSPELSTDISAKLNNLAEGADIKSFDMAKEVLEKNAKKISNGRNKGILQEISALIDMDRQQILSINAKLETNKDLAEKISRLNDDVSVLKEKQTENAEKLSLCAKYENKLRYEQYKDDVKSLENALNESLSFFPGKQLPENETVKNLDSLSSMYTTIESNIKNNSASKAEIDDYEKLKSRFSGHIPSKEQISQCLKIDQDYRIFQQKKNALHLLPQEQTEYESLKKKYGGENISEKTISFYAEYVQEVQEKKNQLSALNLSLSEKQNNLSNLETIKKPNVKRIVFFILSALSCALLFLYPVLKIDDFIFFPVCILPALVFFAAGIFSKQKKQDFPELKNEISSLSNEISNLKGEILAKETACRTFIQKYCPGEENEFTAFSRINVEYARYSNLNKKQLEYDNWLESEPKKEEDYKNYLLTFVRQYCMSNSIDSVPEEIAILSDKINTLKNLEEKINRDYQNKTEIQQKSEKLNFILSEYKTDKTQSYAAQIQKIHDKINIVKNLELNLSEAKAKLKDFEMNPENHIESFSSLKKPEFSADFLQKQLSEISDFITEKNRAISDYQKIMDANLFETDKKDDIETEIERLSGEKLEKQNEFDILEKTLNFLDQAKENIDSKYSAPMKKNFAKYMDMFSGNQKLVIDTELKVHVDDNGLFHESQYLSEGYKDIVNFCSRMALIDSLFKNIVPPVILDDPFVNLDDEKVPKALDLVKKMAESNQIIYFACHKSRFIR